MFVALAGAELTLGTGATTAPADPAEAGEEVMEDQPSIRDGTPRQAAAAPDALAALAGLTVPGAAA